MVDLQLWTRLSHTGLGVNDIGRELESRERERAREREREGVVEKLQEEVKESVQ